MFDYALIEAVAAVIRTGSFEQAAKQLHVTPSAISQRVKSLEERMGTVLILRGQPCEGTKAGLRLCQHLEQVALMERDVRHALPRPRQTGGLTPVRIAINADSLATWFIPAMAEVKDILFDIVLDDQDHSAEWLRRGEVLGAVTSHGKSVQGCDSRPVGILRYFATASPAFMDRWFPRGRVTEETLMKAPCLIFNRKDRLQSQWLKEVFGRDFSPPNHWLPSSTAFVEAALAGLGWGMNPEILVKDHIAAGRLVALLPETPLDVPLYWQASRIAGGALSEISTAVLKAGRAALRPFNAQ